MSLSAYDAELFPLFQRVTGGKEDVDFIGNSFSISKKEKARFLQNEVENPLSKISVNEVELRHAKRQLKEFQLLLESESKLPEAVVALYTAKAKNHVARIDLYGAIATKDAKRFYIASKKIYGAPKKRFFAYTAKRIQALAKASSSAAQEQSALYLQDVISRIDTSATAADVDILPPSDSTDETPISAAEVAQIFTQVINRLEIADWSVHIDTTGDRSRFAVSGEKRVVYIPSDERLQERVKPLTATGAKALAEHEIGVHARRAFEGSRQPLQLLSIGLANYLRGEEGLASYVQQQIEGAKEFYGLDRYLAISLAVGMDGIPRDFRSVFTCMQHFYTLKSTPATTAEQIINAAWDVCIRVFRGTNGQASGVAFTRDLAYLEGNIGIWHLLSEKPHIFESLFVGKFDPMNDQHVRALQVLKILPEW